VLFKVLFKEAVSAQAIGFRNRVHFGKRPRLSSEPMHLIVDSTGLKLCGPGEWLVEKQGTRMRRTWRKLHIGVDADTGEIVAVDLTDPDVDDGAQVGPLLDQVTRPVVSFTGDGAFDRDDVYGEVAKRHPDAAVIVPPRSSAVLSATAETAPTRRDRHLQLIAERGRLVARISLAGVVD
jgi:Transposase DDE domain